jgi:carnosine N-methyltransferase
MHYRQTAIREVKEILGRIEERIELEIDNQIEDIYSEIRNRLQGHLHCINLNAHFLLEIPLFEPDALDDYSKVQTLLRQFVRDWSIQGLAERTAVYSPILEKLQYYFVNRSNVNVLVPGAGLARLVWEIVKLGFNCQGNEFSPIMLVASNFILNCASQQYQIFPWIHSSSNIVRASDLFEPIIVPDEFVRDTEISGEFSMVAGDFAEVYLQEQFLNSQDAIVTCFFMDTAKDIVEYLNVIKFCLKNNGLWINHGPLLYHWDDSITFTLQEFHHIAKKMGFVFESQQTICSTYTENPNCMFSNIYKSSFTVARVSKNES